MLIKLQNVSYNIHNVIIKDVYRCSNVESVYKCLLNLCAYYERCNVTCQVQCSIEAELHRIKYRSDEQ